MKPREYVAKFRKKIEQRDYEGAYEIFQEHPEIVTRLPGEEISDLIVEWDGVGMEDYATKLQETVEEYALREAQNLPRFTAGVLTRRGTVR